MVGENVVPEERRKRFDRLQASAARLELLSGPRFRATVKTPIDALAEWVVEHTREIEIQVPGGILFLRCPEQGFTALSPRGARRMALQGRYIPFENPVTRLRGVQASDGGEVSVTPAEAGVQASHVAFYGGLDSGFHRNDEDGGLDSGFRRNDGDDNKSDEAVLFVGEVVCFRLAPLRGRGTELQAWVTSPAPIEPVFKLMDQIGQTADRGLRWPALVAYWLTQFLRSMDRRRLRRLEEWPPIAGYATDADPQVEATPAGVSPASSPISTIGSPSAQSRPRRHCSLSPRTAVLTRRSS